MVPFPPLHEYVYGVVPPPGEAVALPSVLQLALLEEDIDTPKPDKGWVIVIDAVAVHPRLSFAVIVYVPTARLVAERFVPAAPLHEYV